MRVIGTSTTAYRNALYYENEDGQKGSITASKSVPFDELWRRALIREGYEVDAPDSCEIAEVNNEGTCDKEEPVDEIQQVPQDSDSERAGTNAVESTSQGGPKSKSKRRAKIEE